MVSSEDMAAGFHGQSEVVRGGALCHGCRYPIRGLPREGRCPECGRDIADSTCWLRPTERLVAYQVLVGLLLVRFAALLAAAAPASFAIALLIHANFATGWEPVIEWTANVGSGLGVVGSLLFILGMIICTPPVPWVDIERRGLWIRLATRTSAALLIVCLVVVPFVSPGLSDGSPALILILSGASLIISLVTLTPVWLGELGRVTTRRRTRGWAWRAAAVLAPSSLLGSSSSLFAMNHILAVVFLACGPLAFGLIYVAAPVRYFERLSQDPIRRRDHALNARRAAP